MDSGGQIQYLQHSKIDKEKWDARINNAPNGLIYAYSFYLDKMAKHWDALVLNDYRIVMPLTWNRKYGFFYLYQPAFTASLGVFGEKTDEAIVKKFLEAIPSKFRLVEISLNHANKLPGTIKGSYVRTNYVLDLRGPYNQIASAYRENHKRNISKAMQSGCKVKIDTAVDEVIRLHEEQLRHIDGTKPEDYNNFKLLYQSLKSTDQAKIYAVADRNDQTLASAVFFFSHNRAYYILVGNHPDGKTTGASHALIDAFIRDHAGQNRILDFEGSDIPNLAFFYEGFGAKAEVYPALKIKKLPWYAQLFKK